MSNEKSSDAREFARHHWPEALAAAITVSGAATWLLIRYYKQRKLTESTRSQLDVLENEAVVGNQDTAVLLETGSSVIEELPGSHETAAAMVASIPDKPGQNAMTVLSQLKNPNILRRK
jgi:hypothetical protein